MVETNKEFAKKFRATCEVAYRDCKLEEKQIQTVLKNTGLLGVQVRLWEGVIAASDGLKACDRLEAVEAKIEQQQKCIKNFMQALKPILEGSVKTPSFDINAKCMHVSLHLAEPRRAYYYGWEAAILECGEIIAKAEEMLS